MPEDIDIPASGSTNAIVLFPWQVWLFFAFSSVESIAKCILTWNPGFKQINELVLPYTGWSDAWYLFAAVMFPFVLVFSFLSGRVLKLPRQEVLKMHAGYLSFCRWLLMLAITSGIIGFAWHYGREDFGNPYLMVSPWKPVWTVVVPAFWLWMLSIARRRMNAEIDACSQ
ncbi:hypothetical protein [Planctomicrobium piriforme]|uniref:Uncharacterized protein n=1 Tax=Planctomicrobium piriforme TaxID=1576369 RepID=A0A1I3LAA4_9PLAN|nr:hypothetical protein [Planctomicrobium piriforme]SFI81678.1 hypothetical protein SAMN05421753_112194 [Planctomicrobium piriforme]